MLAECILYSDELVDVKFRTEKLIRCATSVQAGKMILEDVVRGVGRDVDEKLGITEVGTGRNRRSSNKLEILIGIAADARLHVAKSVRTFATSSSDVEDETRTTTLSLSVSV